MSQLVSILIPAYNSEAWLAHTLRSALVQTWPRKEIIVVDDGSTDRTAAVARQFVSSGVRVISQDNQGAAAARNTAYAHCQGDYIQWLDGDDLLGRDKIARQMAELECGTSPETLLSGPWGRFLRRPARSEFKKTTLWEDLSPAEWLIRKLAQNLHMQTATWLVSRKLTEEAGPWDESLAFDDDGEYFARVLAASHGSHFVPGANTYYRMTGFGSVGYLGTSRRKLEALVRSMSQHIHVLQSLEASPRSRAACVAYLGNWYPHVYPAHPDLMAELSRMAAELGGSIAPPRLPLKYEWVRRVAGLQAAHKARVLLPRLKWSAVLQWEEMLARFAHQGPLP